jgi:methionyl-tRNA formyltransferase
MAPKITKEEAVFSSSWAAHEFCNRVKAFFIWPTVKVIFENEALKSNSRIEVKILSAEVTDKKFSKSWGVENHEAFINCQDAFVIIEKAQIPGKGPLSGDLVFQKLLSEGYKIKL